MKFKLDDKVKANNHSSMSEGKIGVILELDESGIMATFGEEGTCLLFFKLDLYCDRCETITCPTLRVE